MITKFVLTSALEIAAAVLVIYGFWHEEKVIAFEEKAIKKVAEMLAHFKRHI